MAEAGHGRSQPTAFDPHPASFPTTPDSAGVGRVSPRAGGMSESRSSFSASASHAAEREKSPRRQAQEKPVKRFACPHPTADPRRMCQDGVQRVSKNCHAPPAPPKLLEGSAPSLPVRRPATTGSLPEPEAHHPLPTLPAPKKLRPPPICAIERSPSKNLNGAESENPRFLCANAETRRRKRPRGRNMHGRALTRSHTKKPCVVNCICPACLSCGKRWCLSITKGCDSRSICGLSGLCVSASLRFFLLDFGD
jgi:hypothetical protein